MVYSCFVPQHDRVLRVAANKKRIFAAVGFMEEGLLFMDGVLI